MQKKDKSTAVILCLLAGAFGVHQYYLGNKGKLFTYILFFFLLGISFIFAIIDLFTLIMMSSEDFDKQYNQVSAQQAQVTTPYNFNNVAEELERLHELKEKGVISAEEFQARKSKLL